jgi:hypothetical protein
MSEIELNRAHPGRRWPDRSLSRDAACAAKLETRSYNDSRALNKPIGDFVRCSRPLRSRLLNFAPYEKLSPLFTDLILSEVAERGSTTCIICGATLRHHVLRALRERVSLEHRFMPGELS